MKKYLNKYDNNVPANTILVVPHSVDNDGFYNEIIESLSGKSKRDWFTPHFYYCLPLTIGNQYGFVIKSTRDFDITWMQKENYVKIEYLDEPEFIKQSISDHFGEGIVTIQNYFALKTAPGINLMTIQPPNMFLPGCVSMTGVVETDNIKRDFTFNIKITIPYIKISIKKGDPLGAFIPIPRYFVDQFNINLISDIFDNDFHKNEIYESNALGNERQTVDKLKPHSAGRRYFNGINTDNTPYPDHQKRIKRNKRKDDIINKQTKDKNE